MISQFQFERLDYFISKCKLTIHEMKFVDEFLADPDMDDKLDWLIDMLRRRSHR